MKKPRQWLAGRFMMTKPDRSKCSTSRSHDNPRVDPLSVPSVVRSASVWFEGVLEGDRRKDVAGGVANEVDWPGRENPLLRRVG